MKNLKTLLFLSFVCVINSYVTHNLITCPVIGIKLGETFSSVGVFYDDEYKEDLANIHIPPVISFIGNSILIGDEAEPFLLEYPTDTIPNIFALIGKSYSDLLQEQKNKKYLFKIVNFNNKPYISIKIHSQIRYYSPEEILSKFLQKLKSMAENRVQRLITLAYVSIPTYFTNQQKDSIKKSASMINLEIQRFVTEDRVLLQAGQKKRKDESNILVFNLERKRALSTIFYYQMGVYNVLSSVQSSNIGEEFFDNNIMSYISNQYRNNFELTSNKSYLSNNKQEILDTKQNQKQQILSAKQEFQQQNSKLFNEAINLIISSLSKINMTKSNISQVILVGGSAKIHKMKQLIQDYFSNKLIIKQEIGSQNIECYEVSLLGHEFCRVYDYYPQLVLETQVLPLSLFIEVFGERALMMHKGVVLPFKHQRVITVINQKQERIVVKIGMSESYNSTSYILGQLEIRREQFQQEDEINLKVEFQMKKQNVLSIRISNQLGDQKYFYSENLDISSEIKNIQDSIQNEHKQILQITNQARNVE